MPSHFLARILETPQLARAVPRLRPEMLQRVIERCGLEDASELVALATPEQLKGVFDLDLWRSPRPGLDETFDPDRFGVWLTVLMELGAGEAAARIAQLDRGLIVTGLSQHVLIFDVAAVSPYMTTDGDEIATSRLREEHQTFEVGGFLVVQRRSDAWDAIVDLLTALDAEQPDCFYDVMTGCRGLSESGRELDGLDDLLEAADQAMFDLAHDRERRRDAQGYATPAQARAFLQSARQLRLDADSAPPPHPIAVAYQRAVATAESGSPDVAASPLSIDEVPADEGSGDDVAAMVEVLIESGVMPERPRGLLEASREPRLSRIQALLHGAAERDHRPFLRYNEQLAFLGNVLAAVGTVQSRPFTSAEASDAVLATCNLGLEHWPSHWTAPAGQMTAVDGPDDLVAVFQAGWSVLYQRVCLRSADALLRTLTALHCSDPELQEELEVLEGELRRHLAAGAPWLAEDAFDALASLDLPSWAALIGLTAECPVMHSAVQAARGTVRKVNPNEFTFIADGRQLADIDHFLDTLTDRLTN